MRATARTIWRGHSCLLTLSSPFLLQFTVAGRLPLSLPLLPWRHPDRSRSSGEGRDLACMADAFRKLPLRDLLLQSRGEVRYHTDRLADLLRNQIQQDLLAIRSDVVEAHLVARRVRSERLRDAEL